MAHGSSASASRDSPPRSIDWLAHIGSVMGVSSSTHRFLNSSAVALSEAIKCAMSLLMIWASRRGANAQSMTSTIYRALFADPKQMLKVCAQPCA